MKPNVAFMAFAKGNEVVHPIAFTKYTGVCTAKILAVNPDRETLGKLQNRIVEQEPVYLLDKDPDNRKVRIEFLMKSVPSENNGIETTFSANFFIGTKYMISNSGKYKVIDKYGRTAWVTEDEYKQNAIPEYSNGSALIDPDYRQCRQGEEELTAFIKNLFGIPEVAYRNNGEVVMRENPENYEAYFDRIDDWFNGDFSELQELVSQFPNALVKVLLGVRTTESGKEYHTVFTEKTLKSFSKDYTYLDAALKSAQERGKYADTVFEVCPLKEYKVTPTDFTQSAVQPEKPSEDNDFELPW